MIHTESKLKRHDLYEIILSVLASRCLYMQDKKGVGSFSSLPQTEVVLKLIQMTQDIFQSEPSLLHLEFDEIKEDDPKEETANEDKNSNAYIVVGDLHGNFDDLLRIFEDNSYPPNTKYIFTGDYIDRGSYSVEIMLLLFSLKNLYPNHVFLLRGNHECQDICSIYGFQAECEIKYSNATLTHHDKGSKSASKNNATPHQLSSLINEIEEKIPKNDPIENIESTNHDNETENNSKDNDDQTAFFDLEINLNSIRLPTLFSTQSTPNEKSEPVKADIETDYFNFENYHYIDNYNDNDQNYNNNNNLIGNDSFYTQAQTIDIPNKVFEAFTEAFTYMPFAAVVADQIFCVHGGISPDVQHLEQIENINRPCLASDNLVTNGILWSDPRLNLPLGEGTGNGFEPSDRGTGYLFNDNRLNVFLTENKLTYLIRSHEPCQNGINKPFGESGRCITVFSNSDYCGMDNNAAVVRLTPKIDTNENEQKNSSSSLSSSNENCRDSESPDSVIAINSLILNDDENQNKNSNNYKSEKNIDVSIVVLNFNDNDNDHDVSLINSKFVKDTVSISFRSYEPLNRNDSMMRRIIVPEWIFEKSSPTILKGNYQENDLFSSIIDEPVDLFYSGI